MKKGFCFLISCLFFHSVIFANVNLLNDYLELYYSGEDVDIEEVKEEIDELMKKCRLYSGSENLKELCSSFGLKCISQEDFETTQNIFFTISVFEKQ